GTVNQLSATVPAGASTGPISIRTTNGTHVTDASIYLVPVISGFTPSSGVGGTEVTINGSSFTGATNVTFDGVAAAFTVASSNRITATVPGAAASGVIAVSTPGGVAQSASSFNVLPVVVGFEPVSASRGTAIEIIGSGLTGVQSVTFAEGATAGFTTLTPNRLRAVVPATAFSGPVTVRTTAGTATSAGPFFVTGATPAITGFTPTTGAAGTDVTIRGAGLRSAQAVDFHGTPASFRFEQGTNLVATVPAGATTGLILVTTVDGAAISATPFNVPLAEVALGVALVPPDVVLRWPTNAPGYTLDFTL
ncbi:MAG TPA: IPT/TIG domain-containing protein, partial [Verrucomicrobiota bacterium]|nr:IPT/TIG domain-containing protein [Verrucomicrobiota bacterium]